MSYTDIDFGSRVSALRAVGAALGLSGSQLPDASSANSQRTYLKWINSFRVAASLSPLPDLDYTGFQPALEALLAAVPPPVPVNTTPPAVTGTPAVGNNLTTSNGVWTNSPTSYTYQWLRGGATIAGATNAVYALVGADSGTNVSCRVTASNAGGAGAPVVSNAVAVT